MFLNGVLSRGLRLAETRNFHDKANNKPHPRRKRSKNEQKKKRKEKDIEWTTRLPLWKKPFNLTKGAAINFPDDIWNIKKERKRKKKKISMQWHLRWDARWKGAKGQIIIKKALDAEWNRMNGKTVERESDERELRTTIEKETPRCR